MIRASGQFYDLLASAVQEGISGNEQRFNMGFGQSGECLFEFTLTAHPDDADRLCNLACRLFDVARLLIRKWPIWIEQDSNHLSRWNQVIQKL